MLGAVVYGHEQMRQALVRKHTGDKIFANGGIVQSAFIFHRNQGVLPHERIGEQAASVRCGHAVFPVDLDARDTARG